MKLEPAAHLEKGTRKGRVARRSTATSRANCIGLRADRVKLGRRAARLRRQVGLLLRDPEAKPSDAERIR
jgi:hypothetical protein